MANFCKRENLGTLLHAVLSALISKGPSSCETLNGSKFIPVSKFFLVLQNYCIVDECVLFFNSGAPLVRKFCYLCILEILVLTKSSVHTSTLSCKPE